MCGYSRHGLSSRLACEGDHLITFRFSMGLVALAAATDTGSQHPRRSRKVSLGAWRSLFKRWVAGSHDRVSMVWVPPGARLRMTQIPAELRSKWALRSVENVWFTEPGTDLDRYQPAIRFRNGEVISLLSLPENIRFVVLSLGSDNYFDGLQMPAWPDDASIPDGRPGAREANQIRLGRRRTDEMLFPLLRA